jgi:hypothetical protein
MRRLIVLLALGAAPAAAQRSAPADSAELDGISTRGRNLAAYDIASWNASDAVAASHPDVSRLAVYVARRDGDHWIVSFGKLNAAADTFFIACQAVEGATPTNYSVRAFDPSEANTGFELHAARALTLAKGDFGAVSRPYNFAVLPGDSLTWWVYAMPAQLRLDRWPLGGDVRYLISPDGRRILAKRQLHRAIVDLGPLPQKADGSKVMEDLHIAVLDVVPEDTDVFTTLQREPHVPHLVITDKFIYRIAPDGSIRYVGRTEQLLKP